MLLISPVEKIASIDLLVEMMWLRDGRALLTEFIPILLKSPMTTRSISV